MNVNVGSVLIDSVSDTTVRTGANGDATISVGDAMRVAAVTSLDVETAGTASMVSQDFDLHLVADASDPATGVLDVSAVNLDIAVLEDATLAVGQELNLLTGDVEIRGARLGPQDLDRVAVDQSQPFRCFPCLRTS